MKITFLGTAAATACPLVFCRCRACLSAWKTGGKDFRKRSCVLTGEDLLIDLGPDLMSAAFAHGADVSRIRCLLQTHSHSDHFDAGHLITRLPEYASEDVLPLEICASHKTLLHMSDALALEETGANLLDPEWQARLKVQLHPMKHTDTINVGGRRITAVKSNHASSDGSLLYVIEEENKAFLCATDTMRFTLEAWALFKTRNFRFDAVAIDHTYGPDTPGGGHLSANEAALEIARLRKEGFLKPSGRAFATHISHEGMPLHEELEVFARENSYEVAWDGLTLEL